MKFTMVVDARASTAMDLTLEEFVAHPFNVGDRYTVERTRT
jgi:hypothetical protein